MITRFKRRLSRFLVCFLLLFSIFSATGGENVHAASMTVSTGVYNILPAVNTSLAMDIVQGSYRPGAAIQIYHRQYSSNQTIRLEYSKGYYTIYFPHSSMVLDVQGAKAKDGTPVIQYFRNNNKNQKWEIISAGNNYYYIKSALGNYYLDVKGGNSNSGTRLQIYHGNKSNAQKFKFSSPVYYEYRTETIKFNNIDEWRKAVSNLQQKMIGLSNKRATLPGGTGYSCGAMIVGATILEYKTIKVTVQHGYNVGSKVTVKMKFPSKIKYKLHRHKMGSGIIAGSSNLYLVTTCSCGFYDAFAWQIPYPDTSDAQKASEATKVYYNNKYSPNYR